MNRRRFLQTPLAGVALVVAPGAVKAATPKSWSRSWYVWIDRHQITRVREIAAKIHQQHGATP